MISLARLSGHAEQRLPDVIRVIRGHQRHGSGAWLGTGPIDMSGERREAHRTGLRSGDRRRLIFATSLVEESTFGNRHEGDPMLFGELQRAALVRRGGHHHSFVSAHALDLLMKDLHEFALDWIRVSLCLYKDEKVQTRQSVPNRGIEHVRTVGTADPVLHREPQRQAAPRRTPQTRQGLDRPAGSGPWDARFRDLERRRLSPHGR